MATRRRWLQFSLQALSFAAFAVLLVAGIQHALRNADESSRRQERLRQEDWLAEQKHALTSGEASSVHFYSTSDTDWLVSELAGMPEIKSLSFELTDLTDEGCTTLAEMPNLTSLTLYGGRSPVGDAGLATLSRSQSIETLQLVNIHVTNDGVAALKSLSRLREVTIFWEPFRGRLLTDNAVKNLSTLQKLGKLNISGGWMSKEAVAQVKESLPSCYVTQTKNWRGR
jgi:uncharacterized protein YfiM (DUF2279 family)